MLVDWGFEKLDPTLWLSSYIFNHDCHHVAIFIYFNGFNEENWGFQHVLFSGFQWLRATSSMTPLDHRSRAEAQGDQGIKNGTLVGGTHVNYYFHTIFHMEETQYM